MSDLAADLFDPDNDWSNRVQARCTGLSPELAEFVPHLAAAPLFWDHRYKVDAAWKRRTTALLKADGADALVRFAVGELARDGSFHGMTDARHVIRDLGRAKPPSPARGLAIGVTLAAGRLRGETGDVASDLAVVARKNAQAMDTYHRVDHDIAGAAFTALGDLPGPAAMEELWALHYWVSPSQHPHKVLVKSVKRAAARLGVPPHEFAERTVPRHGLESDGTLTVGWIGHGALWWNAALDAVLTVHGTGQVTVDWIEEDGTSTRTTAPFRSPTGYKTRTRADSVDYLRRHAQGIVATLHAERVRLAALAGENRTWPWPDWVRYYRDHPVTGVLARALEWEYEVPGGTGYAPVDMGVPANATAPSARVRLRPAEPAPGAE
ncbi:hypothetical protein [Streptomyces sp. NPDC057623]|uniref:hypothetical protein n=1 Tax=Streptomyces sp. NPDC057623 TaxID=3346187 RepID=UPI0036931492